MNKKITDFLMRKVLFLSAIFFLTLTYSCKKDGKLTPDFDNSNLSINFTDTFSIITSVDTVTPIRTDLSIYNLLGLYNDPIYGPVSSSIYTQVLLTGVNLNFGASPVIDSVVLTLAYQDLYGDTATPMSIEVYDLNTNLDLNTDYYSNSYVSHNPTALGSLTFTPNLSDDVILTFGGGDTLPAHTRIKLDNVWGQTILDADTLTELNDNTGFTNFMKGLYITTTDSVSNTSLIPGTGSIAYYDMNSSLSTLTIYYNDTSKYDFTINTEGEKFSRFAHNYTGTDVEAHLNQLPTRDTTVTYVSTMAGVRTKIELPTIKTLAELGSVSVNKAELVVTVENGTEGNFDDALSSMSLVGIDASGEIVFLVDFYEGAEYYGGTLDENTKTYTFNISRHIHQLIYSSSTDYGMYLMANGASTSANRSVLGSEKNPISRIKLNITYSKL